MGKIGIYTAILQGKRTGIGHYVEGLVNELIAQGHKDEIVLIHPEGYHPLYDVVENYTTCKTAIVYISQVCLSDIYVVIQYVYL